MCTINANPEVSGIGIRLSLYTSSMIIACVPRVEETEELRKSLTHAAGLNGVALLVTAVVQTASGSLDLYHAIIIIHMLGFLGVATYPEGAYRATPSRLVVFWITTWTVFATYLVWVTYVWVKSPTFGSRPGCNNSTVYIILFQKVRATVPWLRRLAVTISGLAIISLLAITVRVFIFFWPWRIAHGKIIPGRDMSFPEVPPPMITQAPEDVDAGTPYPAVASVLTPRIDRQPSLPFQFISQIPSRLPLEFSRNKTGTLTRILVTIYGIIMLERTIASNDVGPGENVWSFGQIVAIIIVIGSVNEVVHYFLNLQGHVCEGLALKDFLKGAPEPSRTVNNESPNQAEV